MASKQVDTTGWTFPMEALDIINLGKAEYAAGDVFDALTIQNVNFLKSRKVAVPYGGTTIEPVASAVIPSNAVQAAEGSADSAGSTGTQDAPASTVGAKGTTDDPEPTRSGPVRRTR